MEKLKAKLIELMRDEEGLTIVEYAVAGGLVTVGVVASFRILGANVDTVIVDLGAALVP